MMEKSLHLEKAHHQCGATFVDYGLMVALVAVLALPSVTSYGLGVEQVMLCDATLGFITESGAHEDVDNGVSQEIVDRMVDVCPGFVDEDQCENCNGGGGGPAAGDGDGDGDGCGGGMCG